MVRVGKNWKCPYCGHAQVVSSARHDTDRHELGVKGEKRNTTLFLRVEAVVCANDECRELNLTAQLVDRI